MRKYRFIAQEKPKYCVPACLQMILERNKLEYDKQEKILEICGDQIRKPGMIDKYFRIKNYPLSCLDFLVNKSFLREFEELIREALILDCDILIGYAWNILHNTNNKGNHLSILYQYNPDYIPDVTLIDPDIKPDGIVYYNLNKLVQAMFEVEDGFHIIHKNQQILKELARKYHY